MIMNELIQYFQALEARLAAQDAKIAALEQRLAEKDQRLADINDNLNSVLQVLPALSENIESIKQMLKEGVQVARLGSSPEGLQGDKVHTGDSQASWNGKKYRKEPAGSQ